MPNDPDQPRDDPAESVDAPREGLDGMEVEAVTEEEISRGEIEAAAERERAAVTVEMGAGFTDRVVAAVTGVNVVVTLLAIFSAVVLGAVIIVLSDDGARAALGYFTARPGDFFSRATTVVLGAYGALLRGSLGGVPQVSETLVASIPLILTGLAVAVPLRAGLLNIGGEGQVMAGGVVAGLVGFTITGLPLTLHLPLALVAGLAAGAAYGWLPGFLKAKTGAHEVITTIMLNHIARFVTTYLLTTTLFLQPGRADPISKSIEATAQLPRLLAQHRVHAGLFVVVILAVLMWWIVERSTVGFELNAVGLNPRAATSAGMSTTRITVLAMSLGGALAGMAGMAQILGVHHRLTPGFSAGLGFDGITVALLGRGTIGGTVAAGLLFGGLKAGGRSMQVATGISVDLVVVLQALIIVFIAAPELVRAIYRIRAQGLATGQVSKGWGT